MLRKFIISIVLLITLAVLSISSSASSISYSEQPPTELIYQVDESHPPFEYSSGDEVYGFGMDLGNIIFSAGNYNVRYSSDTWSKVYDRIKKGEIDICGLLAITEDRKKDILFSKPVVKTFRAVYAKRAMKISEITDIAGYRIGGTKVRLL
ncbi:MAG: hypothetical protein APF77_11605 [Clostridia bacterium BRH_c25]|nr:MAG: hypothetical protein APF77_11605 [Clostridia bacterium BRH_c25]